YCGTFASNTSGVSGNWNIGVFGSQMGGIAFPSNPGTNPIAFEGTVNGNNLVFSGGDGSIARTGPRTSNPTPHHGSRDTDLTNNGTVQDSGTWSGQLCQPGTTAARTLASRLRR